MNEQASTNELAVAWIEAWIRMDMDWLRLHLAVDFVHVSPFGQLEGRDFYLETVEPMARKSVQKLTIKEVVASGNQAAVWFENQTAEGAVPSCDWVRVENGQIREIRSFYDPAAVREVLSADDQAGLDGSQRPTASAVGGARGRGRSSPWRMSGRVLPGIRHSWRRKRIIRARRSSISLWREMARSCFACTTGGRPVRGAITSGLLLLQPTAGARVMAFCSGSWLTTLTRPGRVRSRWALRSRSLPTSTTAPAYARSLSAIPTATTWRSTKYARREMSRGQ